MKSNVIPLTGYRLTEADKALEQDLADLQKLIALTPSRIKKRALWKRYAARKAERSPGMVKHLEERMGLG